MLTKDLCNNYFNYKDGILYWNHRENKSKQVNTKFANKPAGYKTSTGYYEVRVDNKRYKTHRIIYLMFNGYIPEEVDHINNIRSDNRIENLRAATSLTNKFNSLMPKHNSSGIKGVNLHKPSNKWRCSMSINNKTKQIFGFASKELAQEFMELWRETVHGNFANNG